MEVAPRITLLTLFALLYCSNRFSTAYTIPCMPKSIVRKS